MSKKVKVDYIDRLHEDCRVFKEKDSAFFENPESVIFTIKQLAIQKINDSSSAFSSLQEKCEERQREILVQNDCIETPIDFFYWTYEINKDYKNKVIALTNSIKQNVVKSICEDNNLGLISQFFLSAIMGRSRIQLDVQEISYTNFIFFIENFSKIIVEIEQDVLEYYDAKIKGVNDETIYNNRLLKAFWNVVNKISDLMPEYKKEFYDILLKKDVRNYVSKNLVEFSKIVTYAPSGSREIIELFFGLNENSQKDFLEISTTLEISEENVRKKFENGLKILKKKLRRI